MRIVKVGVLAPTNKGVPLGVQGESCATEVEFDVRPWLREYPSGTVSAVARREGDPAPYPLTLDVADGMAVWQVSDTDTAKAGEGAVELTLTSGGTRVRSLTFKTLVTASLTDAPVDDDAWYGWLDKAVVKVDETVQAAQRKMAEVDQEWTGLKADVNAKVDECSKAAAQAAEDAHRAKVDAQATAKALESAEGSTAKAEAAAKRAEDAAGQAEGFAAQASTSEGNANAAVTDARAAAGQAEGFATEASKSARDAMASQASANDSAGAAADAAADAGEAASNAEKAKAAAEEAKAAAAVSEANAAKSAADAEAASAGAINVIAPKTVEAAASATHSGSVAIGDGAVTGRENEVSVGGEVTRFVANVSEPQLGTDASTKHYVDTAASNALTATVTDTLVTVDDAVTMPPLSLSFKGVARQDGTPSVDNPVNVQVVTQPVVTVAGKNLVNIADKVVEVNSIGELVPCAVIPVNKTVYVSMMSSGNASPTYNDAASCGMFDDSEKKATYSVLPDSISTGVNKATITPTFIATKHLMFYGYRLPRSSFTMTNYQLEVGGYSAYEPYSGQTVAITLPEEHPYLASLPNGTADEVIIDAYGNVTLVARVGKITPTASNSTYYNVVGGANYANVTITTVGNNASLMCNNYTVSKYTTVSGYVYCPSPNGIIIRDDRFVSQDSMLELLVNTIVYVEMPAKVYRLGKVSLPSLKAGVSNVWIDGGMGGRVTMTYKQDANKVIASLKSQIAALASKAASDEASTSEPTVESDPDYSTGEPTTE